MPTLQEAFAKKGFALPEETPPQPAAKKPAQGKRLPDEYVDLAEEVILKLGKPHYKFEGKYIFQLTTSKIRGILSMVNDIYNVESVRTKEATLLPESISKINSLRVRILYEAGREPSKVAPFVRESEVIEYIKGIGDDRAAFLQFSKYMDALVAYHRYFGGSEQ